MEAFSDMGDDIDDFFDFSNESIIEDEEWGAAVEEGGILVMGSSAPNYYHTEQPSAVLDDEELYMPCEDVAHLEWLSNFVEESMSSSIVDESLAGVISSTNINGKEVNQNTIINNLITNTNANAKSTSGSGFGYGYGFSSSSSSSSSLRRNRLRLWESQVILIDTARAASPVKPVLFDSPSSTSTLTDSEDELTSSKKKKKKNQSKQNNQKKVAVVVEEERNMARKCQHCGSTKTPQWRAGPKGPKTLCNACGVRYKSGRLLPQYRPASSPSFNTTLHSNSHRRVLEMQTLLPKGEEEEEEEEEGTGS